MGRVRPEYPYGVVNSWKLGLIVLGALAVPVLDNLTGGGMRVQDVSAALTLGLLLALPVEFAARTAFRRRVRLYEEEAGRLRAEAERLRDRQRSLEAELRRQKELLQLALTREAEAQRLLRQREQLAHRKAWEAGLERSRSARKVTFSPDVRVIDGASPAGFEEMVRRLLERDGLQAKVVGGRGDQAVDVLAVDAAKRTLAVQCKHTTRGRRVGSEVLYRINGTAGPVYEAAQSMVVTNGFFTRDAAAWGKRHGILLIDRKALLAWAQDADHVCRVVALTPPY
ncbi:restriction endonuclease [Streptomyces avidinii]|uniref:restriction endonuclease n=1 Tax=[Kitasatospora] papulosa TaxID=1464011 RepID=UPI000BDBEF3C|nr:restriction endonuclease [Streptomyces avidinii]SNX80838.1 Restriction endonuclease [Streptomyces microflavus]